MFLEQTLKSPIRTTHEVPGDGNQRFDPQILDTCRYFLSNFISVSLDGTQQSDAVPRVWLEFAPYASFMILSMNHTHVLHSFPLIDSRMSGSVGDIFLSVLVPRFFLETLGQKD